VTVNGLDPEPLPNLLILFDQDLLYTDLSMWPITLGTFGRLKGDFELELRTTSFSFRHEIDLHMLFMIPQVSLSMWSSFWG